MKLGVAGLPNVGKSTLFNAITRAGAQAANYPFCTIEPNVGVVSVPDERLQQLARMHNPEKITPAVVEFVDIAGLVRGASRGEGLGNKFLAHIREVDAVVHVVRCFADDNVVHVDGAVDPLRDMETIGLEFIFADLETVEKRIERTRKQAKSGSKALEAELLGLTRILAHLEAGNPARALPDEADVQLASSLFLLTAKPILYVANIDEAALGAPPSENVRAVYAQAKKEGAQAVSICARVEEELSGLEEEEKRAFLEELQIHESGLDKLIRAGYALLGLISFLTAGPKEVRAWTISRGMRAPQAAGRIHTDFERGFIRAEVVAYDTLMKEGSMAACKERGLIRSEGKEYIVQDGDVLLFRFNV